MPYTVEVDSNLARADMIVVGAGPAGLFSAYTAATTGLSVFVLEKQGSAGRKLLLAGSGMCNLTHAGPVADFIARYGEAGRFVKPALHAFDNTALIAFFEDRGMPMEEAQNGKIFPACRDSRQVLALLIAACHQTGVQLEYCVPIEGITKTDQGFLVQTRHRIWQSTTLVIATGGKSYPITGSTGEGYVFAQDLGHSIAPTAPALSPVIVRDWGFADCMGISLPMALVRLWRDGKKLRETRGDVLFTHQGLSGPGILDFSRYIEPGDQLELNLLPEALAQISSPEAIDARILAALQASPTKALRNVLCSLGTPDRLVLSLLSRAGVGAELRSSAVSRELRRRLAADLWGLICPVAHLGDWKVAMATRGGVSRTEVDPKTMASRVVSGLYFAGEVLDVDGDTGGFNLQFAFSSAWLAGINAAKAVAAQGGTL